MKGLGKTVLNRVCNEDNDIIDNARDCKTTVIGIQIKSTSVLPVKVGPTVDS